MSAINCFVALGFLMFGIFLWISMMIDGNYLIAIIVGFVCHFEFELNRYLLRSS